ncbi:MAG: DUF4166 domain-containing protein [Propionivibrio sp.]|uniref:DUF4166 domain-containing protein n=1 Tax=Propionivibrio sp. TaxID=2212460 RepID=UPI001A4F388E|nr:DUF4166 domain-containing protein [Propionivibrio sp.]MBL8413736.1 DUF4166 domain-containing protein [Propionivibrio sp.]
MKSLMQSALGADWDKLPTALQAHYRFGTTTDTGHMDIEYPQFMQPCLSVLRVFGALVNRSGRRVSTRVEKSVVGDRQYWRRTLTYPEGKVVCFNSFWVAVGSNQLIEFVNPVLGLQMAPRVEEGRLHYRGVQFVVKLGPLLLPIPEWLVLGRTTIVEEAVDDSHFAMDFRLTHPLLGQVFRYSGKFRAASS